MNSFSRPQPDSKRLLILIIMSAIVLYFVFSPALNILYYIGDDYRYTLGGAEKLCSTDEAFNFVNTIGRPLQGYIDCLSYKFAYTLERMRDLRIISVAVMGVSMGLLAEFFCLLGFTLYSAFFMAGCLFLARSLYVDSVLTGSVSIPIPIMLVLLAYFSLEKVNQMAEIQNKSSRLKKYFWYMIAVLLIQLAFYTYTSAGFLFVTLLLAKVLFSNMSVWRKTCLEVLRGIILFCVACIIYFICAYYIIHFHPLTTVPAAYQLDHPNLNFIEILKRMLLVVNVFDANIWGVFIGIDMGHQGLIVLLFLIGGCLAGLLVYLENNRSLVKRQVAIRNLIQLVLLVFVILVLANTFVLLMPDGRILASRLLIGTVTSGLVLLFWGFKRSADIFPLTMQKKIFGVLVAVLFLIAGDKANLSVTANALINAQFLLSTKNMIADHLRSGKELRHVHYIIPNDEYPYHRYYMTSAALVQLLGHETFQLEWCSLPPGAVGEEKDHQDATLACLIKQPKGTIAVSYSVIHQPFKNMSTTLLVNVDYNKVVDDVVKMMI